MLATVSELFPRHTIGARLPLRETAENISRGKRKWKRPAMLANQSHTQLAQDCASDALETTNSPGSEEGTAAAASGG